METYRPKVVCFSCSFGWGYLSAEETLSASTMNWIPVACSGKIDTSHILKAFRSGADGVLILGCPEGHCHFQDGNHQTKKKVYLIQKVLDAFGLEPQRLSMDLALDSEGKRIPRLVNEMRENLAKLGPAKSV